MTQTHTRRAVLRQTTITAVTGAVGFASKGGQVSASGDSRDDDSEGDDSRDGDDSRVRGRVTCFGIPIENATVTFDEEASTTTDSDGAYSRTLDPGTYVLEVSADGYTDDAATITASTGETVEVDFTLDWEWGTDYGLIDVFVTEVGGGSTIPCDISFHGEERYHVEEPHGSIKGFGVNEGWWEVRVSNAEGYSDGFETVLVEAGEEVRAWVQLEEGDDEIPETGRLTGTVTSDVGAPLESATIAVAGERTTVDDDGTFDLEIDDGRYRLEVWADGYEGVAGVVRVRFDRTTEVGVSLRSLAR